MNNEKKETPKAKPDPSQGVLNREGNTVDGEEQVPSGLRPDLEPASKKNKGHGGDGGGVGNSI